MPFAFLGLNIQDDKSIFSAKVEEEEEVVEEEGNPNPFHVTCESHETCNDDWRRTNLKFEVKC